MVETLEQLSVTLQKVMRLKGGENAHLSADLFVPVNPDGSLGKAVYDPQFDHGQKARGPGWINIGDISAALRTSVGLGKIYQDSETPYIACASKHTRPVVIANGRTQLEALKKAMAGDVNSPFGGIFGFNTRLEINTARFLDRMFIEGVISPSYGHDAEEILKAGKKGERRFLICSGNPSLSDIDGIFSFQTASYGNVIRQTREPQFDARKECVVVTGNNGNSDINSLYSRIVDDIQFAGNAAIYLSSNLVFFVQDGAVAGLGDGCGARTIAAEKARLLLERSVYAAISRQANCHFSTDKLWERVLYDTPFTREDFEELETIRKKPVAFSDAFYPKIDGFIETAGIDRTNPDFQERKVEYIEREGGRDVKKTFIPKVDNFDPIYDLNLIPDVVVQPGGSLGDKLVVPIAEKYGVKMVFTMTPKLYSRYQAGEKGLTGRRFFGHHIMV
jgi:AICAR transformylase/IMP cyclohydrolase PurH